jgi:hypothetical protein
VAFSFVFVSKRIEASLKRGPALVLAVACMLLPASGCFSADRPTNAALMTDARAGSVEALEALFEQNAAALVKLNNAWKDPVVVEPPSGGRTFEWKTKSRTLIVIAGHGGFLHIFGESGTPLFSDWDDFAIASVGFEDLNRDGLEDLYFLREKSGFGDGFGLANKTVVLATETGLGGKVHFRWGDYMLLEPWNERDLETTRTSEGRSLSAAAITALHRFQHTDQGVEIWRDERVMVAVEGQEETVQADSLDYDPDTLVGEFGAWLKRVGAGAPASNSYLYGLLVWDKETDGYRALQLDSDDIWRLGTWAETDR